MNTEGIIYLARKLHWTREEIGKLSPIQFAEILKEVQFQESVEEWRRQYGIASLLAAIYNTIPQKRGSKVLKPSDFLQSEMPTKGVNQLEKLAEEKGIKLPTKELRSR